MKVKTVTLSVKRDVRHIKYNVSQCRAELSAELEAGDDLATVYKELHEDTVYIVEEMAAKETADYKRRVKNGTKN
jgi:hypothetical protein